MLSFVTFLLLIVIEYMAFANDLKVWQHASLLKVRYSDHSYLVDLLDLGTIRQGSLNILEALQVMLKVVDVADLRWNRYSFLVCCSDFTIVKEGFVGGLTEACIYQVAANHNAGATLASFTVNGNDVVLVFL